MRELNREPLVFIQYCRKSTEDAGRQTLSLAAQERELGEIEKREQLRIKYRIRESHTAWKEGRPKFNQAIQLILEKKANALLVWRLNRIARNIEDLSMVIKLMEMDLLKSIVTPHRSYSNNAEDRSQISHDLVDAKKYSDLISEEVKRGNRQKFEEGKWPGGLAKPGYLNYRDYLTNESSIVIDNERFHLIKDAFQLIIKGTHTPMEAWRKLNDEWGFRTVRRKKMGGRKLSKNSFYRMLSDPFYYGLMVRPEGQKIGEHIPMITENEFRILQVRLGKRSRPHYADHVFPFKEILKCGECGGNVTCQEKWKIKCPKCQKWFLKTAQCQCPRCKTMVDDMVSARISHYIYFSCVRKTNPNCSQRKMLEIKNLEKQALALLGKYEIREEFKDWAIKYISELNDKEEKRSNESFERLQQQHRSLDQQLKNLTRLRLRIVNDDYDEKRQAYYDEEEKKIIEEISKIQHKLKNYQENQKKWVKLTKDTFNFACYGRYWFEKGDAKTKTAILSKLGKNLAIKDGEILIDPYKPFFLIEKTKSEINNEIEVVRTTEEYKEKIDDPNYILSLEPVSNRMRRWWGSNPRIP